MNDIRLNMTISTEVKEILDTLCKDTDQSMSQTVRKSIRLYAAVHLATKEGAIVMIRDDEGGERQIVIV